MTSSFDLRGLPRRRVLLSGAWNYACCWDWLTFESVWSYRWALDTDAEYLSILIKVAIDESTIEIYYPTRNSLIQFEPVRRKPMPGAFFSN